MCSMISAQCDELRAMAESVGLSMPQAATLMMGAADTIWELRDDLQRANDAVRDAEHDESCAWDRVRKAEYEADKLRELAVLNWEWAHSCCGSSCKVQTDGCGYGIDRECNYEREIYDRMHELGIEVD